MKITDFSVPHLTEDEKTLKSWIFDIQRYSINDGPGIRTTVFFKGCPLSCIWCDNPESQYQFPELFFFDSLCVRCYRCVPACPARATTMSSEGVIQIDRQLCKACGSCLDACLSEARAISGKLMTVDEVLEIVKKDSLFYRNSGGGVTASGGEATSHPEFLLEFFKRCQKSGIHTTLDTCGYVPWEVLEVILEYTDLVLYDIKHMDLVKHIEFTGVENVLILENVERIVQRGKPLRMRIPLIPGLNDSEENLRATAQFITGLGIGKADILPYHRFGAAKYGRLGKKYKLSEAKSYKEEEVEAIKMILESFGLAIFIA